MLGNLTAEWVVEVNMEDVMMPRTHNRNVADSFYNVVSHVKNKTEGNKTKQNKQLNSAATASQEEDPPHF